MKIQVNHDVPMMMVYIDQWLTQAMNNEELRLVTFRSAFSDDFVYPTIRGISVYSMATHGFYYTGRQDRIRCNFCEVELYNFQPYDDVATEHIKYSPNCPLIKHTKFCGNITVFSAETLVRDLERGQSGVYQIARANKARSVKAWQGRNPDAIKNEEYMERTLKETQKTAKKIKIMLEYKKIEEAVVRMAKCSFKWDLDIDKVSLGWKINFIKYVRNNSPMDLLPRTSMSPALEHDSDTPMPQSSTATSIEGRTRPLFPNMTDDEVRIRERNKMLEERTRKDILRFEEMRKKLSTSRTGCRRYIRPSSNLMEVLPTTSAYCATPTSSRQQASPATPPNTRSFYPQIDAPQPRRVIPTPVFQPSCRKRLLEELENESDKTSIENEIKSGEGNCALCKEQERNIVILPCKHLASCAQCTSKLHKCPACRGPIKDFIKVFVV